MRHLFFTLCLFCLSFTLWGQTDSDSKTASDTPFVQSTWPGVEMHILEVQRLAGNRLLIAVGLVSKTSHATSIDIPPVIPPNATAEEKALAQPTPFSLGAAVMTEDATQKQYAVVHPAPNGPVYRPSEILTQLGAGEQFCMTIQFPAPPPPVPDDKGVVPKQTVSILLPNAKGPITKVVIPPPTVPAK